LFLELLLLLVLPEERLGEETADSFDEDVLARVVILESKKLLPYFL
jgi:hypothetical protein